MNERGRVETISNKNESSLLILILHLLEELKVVAAAKRVESWPIKCRSWFQILFITSCLLCNVMDHRFEEMSMALVISDNKNLPQCSGIFTLKLR